MLLGASGNWTSGTVPSEKLLQPQSSRQAPGGDSSLLLGVADGNELVTVSSNKFANGANQNCGNMISDRPSTRVRQAPGGHTTICLSYDETPTKSVSKEALKIFEESSSIKAAGGEASSVAGKSTLCFDLDIPCSSGVMSHRQAPGGASTVCLGYSPEIGQTPMKLQPPGGNASICLGVDDDEVVLEVNASGRHPPGGDSTVNLGSITTQADELGKPCRPLTAPGGKATICLSLSDEAEAEPQADDDVRPVGGATTICLGLAEDDASSDYIAKEQSMIRPIGGPSTICLGLLEGQEEEEEEPHRLGDRVAPGGATTICLGLAELSPRQHNDTRPPPGGNATICLDGLIEDEPSPCDDVPSASRPIGGATTICLGLLDEPEAKPQEPSDRMAPGGTTTICLGLKSFSPRQRNDTRPPPGGNTTICLGVENDENCNVLNTTICFGDEICKKAPQILGTRPSSGMLVN